MTADDHRQTVASYRAMKGKGTPAEHMSYLWARQAIGDALTAGQRAFLAAAQKPAWHHAAVSTVTPQPAPAPPARAFANPAVPAPAPHPEPDDVPAWVTEDEQ